MSKFSSIVPPIYFVYLIVFAAFPCRAEFLDYRDVITDSIGYSASLRVKHEDVYISNAQYRSNFAGLFPEIRLGSRAERYENIDDHNNTDVNMIGNEVIGGSQSAWKSSVSVSGQYYVSNWYKKIFEAWYFEKLRDTSLHDCETEIKKMMRDVTDIFRSLAEGEIKLKYAREVLSRLNEIFRMKKEAFSNGQFSHEDVLKAQTDVLNMEKEMTGINKDLRESFEKLGNFTGKSYPVDTEIIPLPLNSTWSIPDETAAFIAQTPEYKARENETQAFKFKDKSVGNNFLPDISIYGRYDLYNSSPHNMDDSLGYIRPTDYSVGVYVSLPLFDGGVRRWEREKSFHELKKAEENARLVFNEKNKEIKTLQVGHAELSKSYDHYQKINEQYKKIMEINKKSQDLGEVSSLDIMELEKDTLLAERDMKMIELALAVYEKQLSLEFNFNEFAGEYGGNGTCQY